MLSALLPQDPKIRKSIKLCIYILISLILLMGIIISVVIALAKTFDFESVYYKALGFPPGYKNVPSYGLVRPGRYKFSRANSKITSKTDVIAYGNTDEAIELAKSFSETLQKAEAELFTGGSKLNLLDMGRTEFKTFCELHKNECAFIVYVPELRRYESSHFKENDALSMISKVAWLSAYKTLQKSKKKDLELAIGLRGSFQYGPIALGYYKSNNQNPDSNMIIFMKDGSTKTHYLWSFFIPQKKE